jgi:multiple sugar transport system permease protein
MTTVAGTRAPSAPSEAAGEKPSNVASLVWKYVVRILLSIFFAFPLVFMFVSSLKPDTQIFAHLSSLKAFLPVGHISLDNYTGVFRTPPAARFLLNSVLITMATILLGLLVNSMAAFALSRMHWRGKTIVLAAVIATLVVPFETFALPLVWWVNKLPWIVVQNFVPLYSIGWLDSYRVQIIPFIANAFSIYLYYSYFQSIPKDLDEAARVDGAGWFRIYRSVIMPLAGPATATVAILTFLPAWNSYLWPLMVVQTESLRPVMVGVSYFQQLNVL